MRSVVFIALSARVAAAEPVKTIDVAGRGQVLLTARDELILGASAGFGLRWDDRWQLALRGGLSFGDAFEHQYADALVEAGLWLHPSSSIDLELGWRIGYSYIHLRYGAHVHALMIENVFALLVNDRFRVEPIVFTAYHSGPWQVGVGARVGVSWSL